MNLRFVLLALLSDEPNTGYGLGRALNGEVKHLWDTSLQQIYGELRAMQTASLIEQQIVAILNRPAKKIYSITPQGRVELDRWLAGPAVAQRQKDSFLVKLYCRTECLRMRWYGAWRSVGKNPWRRRRSCARKWHLYRPTTGGGLACC